MINWRPSRPIKDHCCLSNPLKNCMYHFYKCLKTKYKEIYELPNNDTDSLLLDIKRRIVYKEGIQEDAAKHISFNEYGKKLRIKTWRKWFWRSARAISSLIRCYSRRCSGPKWMCCTRGLQLLQENSSTKWPFPLWLFAILQDFLIGTLANKTILSVCCYDNLT